MVYKHCVRSVRRRARSSFALSARISSHFSFSVSGSDCLPWITDARKFYRCRGWKRRESVRGYRVDQQLTSRKTPWKGGMPCCVYVQQNSLLFSILTGFSNRIQESLKAANQSVDLVWEANHGTIIATWRTCFFPAHFSDLAQVNFLALFSSCQFFASVSD